MFKDLKRVLKDRVTLKIIPHSESNVLSFSMPRSVIVITIFLLFILQSTTTLLLFHYSVLFERESERSIRFLERLDEVQQENYNLRNSVEYLAAEAERIKDKLLELERQDERIRELIDTSGTTSFLEPGSNDPGSIYLSLPEIDYIQSLSNLSLEYDPYFYLSEGMGGDISLADNNPFFLVNRAQSTFYDLKRAIPEQIESYEILEEDLRSFSEMMAATPSIWPLLDEGESLITSTFGYRFHPISRQQQFHEGIDIGVWYNTPVVSTAIGIVEFSGWKGGFGRTVVVDHGFGYKTVYAHNNSLVVEEGETVERGDIIAYSGNSGYSTGPHLHYEVIYHGEPEDPMQFF